MKAIAAAALALTGVQALYIAPPVLEERRVEGRQQNTVHYERWAFLSEETLSEADIQMLRYSDYQNTVHYEADYQQTSSIDYRTVHYEVSDAA